jgi:uncharacterized membrane protein YhdT
MKTKRVYGVAKRAWFFAWLFYGSYLAVMMGLAYSLGNRPYWLGLPLWVAVACVAVPAVFVGLLIVLVEKLIPNVPLEQDREDIR